MYYPETLYFEPSTGELNASMMYDFCEKQELGKRRLPTLQKSIRDYYKNYYKEDRGEDCRIVTYTSNRDGIFYISSLDLEYKDALEKLLTEYGLKKLIII